MELAGSAFANSSLFERRLSTMSDPFAMLDPIGKPRPTGPPQYAPPLPVAPLHPVGGAPGHQMGQMGMFGGQPPAPHGMGMNGGMNMGMGMGMGGGMPTGMAPGMGHGSGMGPGMGMPMGGMGGMGGIGGMGGMGGMGMAPPQAQAPIMYDSIKNLLQQKPKAAVSDEASLDFLENLGTAKANSVSLTSPAASAVAVDPFGGSAPAPPAVKVSTVPDIGGFTFPGETSTSLAATTSPSGGAKSSALADRMANRRKTQEDQRQQLGFNATAFNAGGSTRKISLKDMAPGGSSKAPVRDDGAPSLEDFAAGKPVFQSSDDPFGGSSASVPSSDHSHSHHSGFDSHGEAILSDSDADFDKKLSGVGSGSGPSSRNGSGSLGNVANPRTNSGSKDIFW